MSFVHLHVHSQYSLLEACLQFKPMLGRAVEFGMPAVAITDNGNMFGAIEFYFAAKAAGVKPLIGMEVYLAAGSRLTKGENRNQLPNRRLVLLAENYQGYQNLCRISSIGFQEGFYYKPRIDYEILEKYGDNLIALSGDLWGEIPWTYLNQGPDAALEKVQWFQKYFPDRFYLELNRTGLKEWEKINPFLLQVSRDHSIPVVATNDVYFLEQEDQLAQEVLICIGSNKTLRDESRFRLGSDQFYFKSAQQMRELFRDIPDAVDNTLKIAERCQVEFKLKDKDGKTLYHLPTYPTNKGTSLSSEIKRLAEIGLEKRFEEAKTRNEEVSAEQLPAYNKRLEYELSVINAMGFNGYFLIVQDFIGWAKSRDIPVGPGRGSGAGSLVAYCLGITDLDPVKYHLIFERFLNPERISMPDFDIDFCQERRQEVIEYVTQKYGQGSVSQIITYGKLQARAAIRDVGRVLGMTYPEVDAVAKLMPEKLGITLAEALEMEPRLREMMDLDPQIATLMELAQKIEGLVRHAGIHAAGVIIADGNLVERAPLYRGVEGENVVQYDMKHAEKIGLIKFDFLGLKTLTLIHDALNLIEKNSGNKIRPQDIPLSDPGIYEIMGRGDTAGIFQFEGDGISDTIKKIRPNSFADITAINALYRPGPMDMIPEYTARKHGETQVEYLFPELADILQETYGIIVYQEQVQLIAAKIASYSLGEADLLRRAMGKKIAEEMARQRQRFMEGALKNGHDEKKAAELFDLMAEFANYGFNKSHAAAYCVVAAQTAWLKNYHPVEFYAALLSTEMSDTDKVVKYVKDARRHGIEVLPPSINRSDYKFSGSKGQIFFGLGAIKGVGQSAVEAVMEARKLQPGGRFSDLETFFSQVDSRCLNKKTIECLIKGGAFDEYGVHRAKLMHNYPRYLERAGVERKDRELGQASLFAALGESQSQKIVLEDTAPWSRSAWLTFEKEVLGFYLSDHPLRGLEGLFKLWTTGDITSLKMIEHKKRVVLAGLVAQMRELITRKGTRMAFAQLEDLSGTVELVVFPDVYAKAETALKSEQPLLVGGVLENENDSCKIIVDSVSSLEEVTKRSKRLVFRIDESMQNHLPELKELFSRYPGNTGITFEVQLQNPSRTVHLNLEEPVGVSPSGEMFERIHDLFGRSDFVEVSG